MAGDGDGMAELEDGELSELKSDQEERVQVTVCVCVCAALINLVSRSQL